MSYTKLTNATWVAVKGRRTNVIPPASVRIRDIVKIAEPLPVLTVEPIALGQCVAKAQLQIACHLPVNADLQRVVVTIRFVLRQANGVVSEVRNTLIVGTRVAATRPVVPVNKLASGRLIS